MKKWIFTGLLAAGFFMLFAQRTEHLMRGSYENTKLSAFIEAVQAQCGVKVYYPTDLPDTLISIRAEGLTALGALQLALQGSRWQVSAWHSSLVVLHGERLIDSLPRWRKPDRIGDHQSLPEKETPRMTEDATDFTRHITVGKRGGRLVSGLARIRGRILNAESGEPVFSATVYLPAVQSGSVTDPNGYFTLILEPGLYQAEFGYMGFEKQTISLDVLSGGDFSISLKRKIVTMKEVVVSGDRQMSIKAKDPGLDKISMRNIRELPMMMGERDIMAVSETLPGIVSAGEGASGLNVRGGDPDQNAFYLNRIPLYNTSHLFGFFPAFNADIIRDFSIYKGHVPASYGGRLSSVFNILTRQGNRKTFTAHGGLSPITANLVAEGPVIRDTLSVLLSGRTTYSDWILKRLNDPDLSASSAGFYDVAASVHYDLSNTQISLVMYHSSDDFRLSGLSEYWYTNSGASLSFRRNFSQSHSGDFTLVAARYAFGTIGKDPTSLAYRHEYNLTHYELRLDMRYTPRRGHLMEYGAGITRYGLNRGDVLPNGEGSLRKPVSLGSETGLESAVYLTDTWEATHWLSLSMGLRYTLFTPMGGRDIYLYSPGAPKDPRYITDTLRFAEHTPVAWYHEPDIRATINLETDANGSVKLAFNQMWQNLFMLNNTLSVAPNTQWKMADYHLKPSRSHQYSAGVFRQFPLASLEMSAEFFYKRSGDYTLFRDGADFLSTPEVETTVIQGQQRAYGLELFVKRSQRRLEGWMSYTWSRSMAQADGFQDWEKVNKGQAFPSNFDIPHAVNLVLSYHVSRRITFSAIMTYLSGKPVTYPVSVYYINEVPMLDYSARNAYRIPHYFRTDLSLTLEGNLKKRKLLHSSFNLSVYNLTGRDNPFSVFFRSENGKIKSYSYSVIAVPVFTATWIFKLGNYASD